MRGDDSFNDAAPNRAEELTFLPFLFLLSKCFNDAAPNRAEERVAEVPCETRLFSGFNDAAPNRAEEQPCKKMFFLRG